MPKYKEYSSDSRKAVVIALKKGRLQSEFARSFNVSWQLVITWNKVFNKEKYIENKPRSGHSKKTTCTDDFIIKIISTTDCRKFAVITLLFKRQKTRKKDPRLLSTKNRKAGVAFAKRYKSWRRGEWPNVLWSDERKFNLISSDGIKYTRRLKKKKYNVRHQIPTVKHEGGNVKFWSNFSLSGVRPLVQIDGNMDQYMYTLKTHMLPYTKQNMPALLSGIFSKIMIRNTNQST